MKRRGFFKAFAGLPVVAVAEVRPTPKKQEVFIRLDAEHLRNQVMPEITKLLETGVKGHREKLAEILRNPQ